MGIIQFIASLSSGGVIIFVLGMMNGRKKRNADLQTTRLLNLESSIEIYEKIHHELTGQLDNVSNKCLLLSQEIEELRNENISLKAEIHDLNERLKHTNSKEQYSKSNGNGNGR